MTTPELEALIAYLEVQLSTLAAALPQDRNITLGPKQLELLRADPRFMQTPHLERIFGIAGTWQGAIILADTHTESK